MQGMWLTVWFERVTGHLLFCDPSAWLVPFLSSPADPKYHDSFLDFAKRGQRTPPPQTHGLCASRFLLPHSVWSLVGLLGFPGNEENVSSSRWRWYHQRPEGVQNQENQDKNGPGDNGRKLPQTLLCATEVDHGDWARGRDNIAETGICVTLSLYGYFRPDEYNVLLIKHHSKNLCKVWLGVVFLKFLYRIYFFRH